MIHARAKSAESLFKAALDRAGVELLAVPRAGGRWIGRGKFIPEPVPDATMAALWGTDLVEEVLTEIGRVPER